MSNPSCADLTICESELLQSRAVRNAHWACLSALLGCTLVISGCSRFEPPISRASNDDSTDPIYPIDDGKGDEEDEDASPGMDASLMQDSGAPSARDDDAGQAVIDAGAVPPDAGPPEPIPARPMLQSCGFGASVTAAALSSQALNEISGLAVSRRNARIIWLVEDSGNGAAVHAVNDEGKLVATYTLGGGAVDYEDIAIGPGPVAGAHYLYIGDVGDNNGWRPNVVIYRAPEPQVAWDQTFVTSALEQLEPLPMKYPDGAINAEALMVDPANEDIYIVTKDGFRAPNKLYRLAGPHKAATLRTMEKLGAVFAGTGNDISINGGDISADGKRIILRSLYGANHWTRAPGVSIADTMLKTLPCAGPIGAESKGESIGFSSDGYYTISEGALPPFHFVPFVPPSL